MLKIITIKHSIYLFVYCGLFFIQVGEEEESKTFIELESIESQVLVYTCVVKHVTFYRS